MAAAQAALAIDPEHVDALVNSGVAAQQLGRLDEAVAAYDKALALAPALGALRHRATRARSRPSRRRARKLRRGGRARAGRCRCALRTRRGVAASRSLRRGPGQFREGAGDSPANGDVLGSAAFAALRVCDWTRAERWGHEIVLRIEKSKPVSPFALLALSDSARLHALAARNFVRDRVRISARPPSAANRRGERSASPMWRPTISPPPARLRRWRPATTAPNSTSSACLTAAPPTASAAPRSALRSTSSTTSLRGPTRRQRLLREIEDDIAVVIDGYAEDGRFGIFAARPAPIQVNFGYPTMGAEFIDYIIADRTVLPFDQQKVVTEKIVQLPDCFQASDRGRGPGPELPSREAACLPATGTVFCCFAESFKVARPVFDVWMRLLSRTAGGVLWLSPGSDVACARLRSEASARGIDPARLVFASPAPPADHLSLHRLADLFLDTLPFNAAAAPMPCGAGVPVVTCKGNAFAARIGASLDTAAGPIRSDALRSRRLRGPGAAARRGARNGSPTASDVSPDSARLAPLFDLDRFRRHLEAAYARMYALSRSGTPPQELCRDGGLTRQSGTMPSVPHGGGDAEGKRDEGTRDAGILRE